MISRALLRRAASFLPGQWRLPAIANLDRLDGAEPEIGCLAVIGPCRGIAVDVGANYGLYSYALSKLYPKVIAFEPNAKAAAPLAAWKSSKVELVEVALSAEQGDLPLYIPRTNGFETPGWGSFDPHNCPGAVDVVELWVKVRTLDSFELRDVGFIKIDAEGHELQVLQGASETIRVCKPNLLVEVRKDKASVYALLASWGYEGCRLDYLAGVQGSPDNVIFRPIKHSSMA